MDLRQPIEGDIVISAQGFNSTCHFDGSNNYIPNSLSLYVNNVEFPVGSIISYQFGFIFLNLPTTLYGGDIVRLSSKCDSQTTLDYTTKSTNFIVVAQNATICNNTSPVQARYNDLIKLFVEGDDSKFNLQLNGQPLTIANFDYQQYQTGTFTSDGLGNFTGVVGTNNETGFSKVNYAPSNTLRIAPTSGYFTIRFGVIELIFIEGDLQYTNFANGQTEQALGTYTSSDVFEIQSTNSAYTVLKNGTSIYSYAKNVTLTPSAGSITPSTVNLNQNTTWTLPTSPGNYTVTAQIETGIRTETEIFVDYCRATADNKETTVTRGTTNNVIPTLSGTVPNNCTDGGFRIDTLPSCGVLKLNNVNITVNQIIPFAQGGNIRYDISGSCNAQDYTFTYTLIASGSGCQNSNPATVTIHAQGCNPNWQNVGEPYCEDCIQKQNQEDLNASCSGSTGTRVINTGNNTPCLQAVWSDTGQVRCSNCVEEKEQSNTNPCITVPNRWVANPTGNQCNSNPIWEDTQVYFCNSCVEEKQQRDNNPCSSSFGDLRVIPNPGGNQCNRTPSWQNQGEPFCLNCKTYILQRDLNQCSPSYNQTRNQLLTDVNVCNNSPNWVPLDEYDCINCVEKRYFRDDNPCSLSYLETRLFDNPSGTACNTAPIYEPTDEYRCNGIIHEQKNVNINPCYEGSNTEVWVPTGQDACFCEKEIKIKAICDDKEISSIFIQKFETPNDPNRLISWNGDYITFKADNGINTYSIFITSITNVKSVINLKYNCKL